MRSIIQIAFLLFFGFPLAVHAAGERHALVIGNSNYGSSSSDLKNPLNDARDIADQLAALGYEVYGNGPALDLDAESFEDILAKFARDLPVSAHVVFYYAGHGMGDKEDNYLIPVRHKIKKESQLRKNAISVLRDVIAPLTEKNPGGVNVVLLDACRNNPLGSNSRGIYGGFRNISELQEGVFVGYAAGAGKVADDGTGRNGIYTAELLNAMRDSSDKIIEVAHKEAADRVYLKTAGEQFPESKNKIYGNWCFGQCGKLDVTIPSATQTLPVSTPGPVDPENKLAEISNSRMLVYGGIALAVIAVLANGSDGGGDGVSRNLVITPP